MIPVADADLAAAEPLVLAVLRSGVVADGPMVRRFEELFAAVVGVDHAVAVDGGATALVTALQALDLRPGDEVVTSPLASAATLNAILAAGATARFADVSADDFCVDPSAVAAVLGPRTRVLMPVHRYGQMADMSRLTTLASHHGLALVEDASGSVGATFDDTPAGSYGLGCFALDGAGGGVLTTWSSPLAGRLRELRDQGMSDLHAAVGIPRLERLAAATERGQANAEALTKSLDGIPGLVVPRVMPGRTHVWHRYTVLVTEDAAVPRDELSTRLTEKGVGNAVHHPKVVFDHDRYRDHPGVVAGEVPVASRVTRQALSLPVHPGLTTAELATVVEAVRAVLVP